MNNEIEMLGIIPCTKAKIWDLYPKLGSVVAQSVYTNPFHALARTYTNLFTPSWVILSAKYGFLSPYDWVEGPYDVTFDRENDPCISNEDLKLQIINKELYKYKNIIIIANNRYVEKIRRAFLAFSPNLQIPFEDIEDDIEGALMLNNRIQQVRKELCHSNLLVS